MSNLESRPIPLLSAKVQCKCLECNAPLAILRVIAGKAGCEYWTMRCTRCGSIHLDIVKSANTPLSDDAPLSS
jgi:Zn finger protein HypA/HybF involved in hydrogenase expression